MRMVLACMWLAGEAIISVCGEDGTSDPPETTTSPSDFGEASVKELDPEEEIVRRILGNGDTESKEDIGRTGRKRPIFGTPSTTEGDLWEPLGSKPTPFISYRDFPGKSGVGSWKEVGVSNGDNRIARKMEETAASLSKASGYSSQVFSVGLISALWMVAQLRTFIT